MLPPHQQPENEIAALNLRIAEGIPGLPSLKREACLATLDGWATQVASETNRLEYLFRRAPGKFEHSVERFRTEVLVTVLQRDLHVHYNQELTALPDHDFFRDPRNLFIHGVFAHHGGTCMSLPVVFIAVGRRLGYPLKLVPANRHMFARWDGDGVRFNIECTSRGFISHPDEHYLTWPTTLTQEEAKKWGQLRSLSLAGEAAAFCAARGLCLFEQEDIAGSVAAYADAADLDPEAPAHLCCLEMAAKKLDRHQRTRLMPGFPPVRVIPKAGRYRTLSRQVQCHIAFLMARNFILDDPMAQERWWKPLRLNPSLRPPAVPAFIVADLNAKPGECAITFLKSVPADYDAATAYPN